MKPESGKVTIEPWLRGEPTKEQLTREAVEKVKESEGQKMARGLLTEGESLDATRRFSLPFPMGVFGTLRTGRGNNHLMHRGKFTEHHKAFMPHFQAQGLTITFNKGSSAPFEVFCYPPAEWKAMIYTVDALEGFNPASAVHRGEWGYYRTLAWLHILPADFQHELFENLGRGYLGLSGTRDLQLPEAEWNKYPRMACWVYSSRGQNKEAKDTDTVIWG